MQSLFVADDNEEFARFVATVAQRLGWTVEICLNGLELLEKLAKGDEPAVLMIDINMPELDGIEVIDGISELGRKVRIHFMTGGSETLVIAAKMIATARDLAVGPMIFKPCSIETLTKLLQQDALED
ncbi:MAG: response regulator [Pelagimonas sp.]|jgi:CheY-like chemotaxis protein|nr:response regulator [Pelagimonas sp.]